MSRTILYEHGPRANATARPVRVRSVALPVEHGGWGISLEPVALGLLVAPSLAAAFLSIATLGAFLARHPLKLVTADRRRGRTFPRTVVARRFVLLYGAVAALGLLCAMLAAPDYSFLLPLAAAAPLALVQLIYDGKGSSRSLLPELAGSVSMAAVAASIALAGGLAPAIAFALWALLAARVVPTILYVRARLQVLHGGAPSVFPVIAAHVLALGLALLLVWLHVAPLLAAAALALLLLRAALGLSARVSGLTAKQVGIRELCFGVLTVLAVGAGYLLGW